MSEENLRDGTTPLSSHWRWRVLSAGVLGAYLFGVVGMYTDAFRMILHPAALVADVVVLAFLGTLCGRGPRRRTLLALTEPRVVLGGIAAVGVLGILNIYAFYPPR
jgi:hypothetical protein